jgi:hypothetical protein
MPAVQYLTAEIAPSDLRLLVVGEPGVGQGSHSVYSFTECRRVETVCCAG